jgi:parallel beta-helix repeat protein
MLTTQGRAGIKIAASGVTIDLNGFQIGSFGGGAGIIPSSTAIERVVIRNGSILNATSAINLEAIPAVTVTDLSIESATGRGIYVGADARIEDCTVIGCGSVGITVGERSHVTGCTSTDNSTGIIADSSSIVTRCTASDNRTNGIDTSSGCFVSDCVARSNDQNGIASYGVGTITRCVSEFNEWSGIDAAYNAVVTDCMTFANQRHGIVVYSAALIKGNNCVDNGSDTAGSGITANWGENRIEGNTCIRNYRGIRVLNAGNIVIANTCTTSVVENWEVVAGNKCYVVSGVNSGAINGNSGGVSPGSTNPWANFSY